MLSRFFLPLMMMVSLLLASCSGTQVPRGSSQAIVGITDGWNSSHVILSMVEKDRNGKWKTVLGPYRGRLGHAGTVWGLGLHQNPLGATTKREGDGRSPAGIYELGGLWVRNPQPVVHDPAIPCTQVGPQDLWVSDLKMPHLYNRHVRLDHPAQTAWEKREQMNLRDYHHSIKMLVHHNTPQSVGNPRPGKGSAIFFHIWRQDGARATAGCTALSEMNLREFIARLRADKKPVYILLPRQEYTRLRQSWNLP